MARPWSVAQLPLDVLLDLGRVLEAPVLRVDVPADRLDAEAVEHGGELLAVRAVGRAEQIGPLADGVFDELGVALDLLPRLLDVEVRRTGSSGGWCGCRRRGRGAALRAASSRDFSAVALVPWKCVAEDEEDRLDAVLVEDVEDLGVLSTAGPSSKVKRISGPVLLWRTGCAAPVPPKRSWPTAMSRGGSPHARSLRLSLSRLRGQVVARGNRCESA